MKQGPNCPKPLKRSKLLIYLRGNYYVKDLIDVLTESNVKPSDFIYTKFVTTIILIVPVGSLKEFEQQYELWTENVIPGSARRLGVPEKDGLTVWYCFFYLGKWIFLLQMSVKNTNMMITKIMIQKKSEEREKKSWLLSNNSVKGPEKDSK